MNENESLQGDDELKSDPVWALQRSIERNYMKMETSGKKLPPAIQQYLLRTFQEKFKELMALKAQVSEMWFLTGKQTTTQDAQIRRLHLIWEMQEAIDLQTLIGSLVDRLDALHDSFQQIDHHSIAFVEQFEGPVIQQGLGRLRAMQQESNVAIREKNFGKVAELMQKSVEQFEALLAVQRRYTGTPSSSPDSSHEN